MKKYYTVDGRLFVCYVKPGIVNHVSVDVWEIVRPKWKIFRSKYRNSYTFWIFEFDTIEKGVVKAIRSYLEEEQKDKAVVEKWQEFQSN